MEVLLLGGTGSLGRRTAAELLRSDSVERLTIASRSEGRSRDAIRHLGGGANLQFAELDIEKPGDVAAAADDHSIVVSCAGPASRLEVRAAREAIRAGRPYVSASDSAQALTSLRELDGDARERSVCIATGFGLSPGIANLLVMHASEDVDEVATTEISMATASAEGPGDGTLIDFFSNLGSSVDGGQVEPVGAPRQVYFPEPVGWLETFPCPHPEVVSMQGRGRSGLVRFRIGLAERVGMDLVRAARGAGLLRTEGGRKLWLSMVGPMRPLVEKLPPKGAAWTAIRIDVHGRTDGRTKTVSVGVVDHLMNMASSMLAYAAVAIGVGGLAEPGVHAPEELMKPGALKDLTTRGIRFARLEPQAY